MPTRQGQKQGRQERREQVAQKGHMRMRARRRLPAVPPPESEIWPREYRGQRWKPIYAFLFAGKCQLCVYSCPPSRWRQGMDRGTGLPRVLLCTNRPDGPGELLEVLPTETCRNFRARCWRRRTARGAEDSPGSPTRAAGPGARRIPVGQGLFATVDAADYRKLCRYKWYAYRRGRKVYAVCRRRGKTVYLHRMIMRPRRGYLVDHIDGNGLNNRRGNLRVCTPAQNRANSRPCGGVSGLVGVYPKGNKWRASIVHRGRFYYLGLFDDQVAAAKARDRKAYELCGPYAYRNFPQDFQTIRPKRGHKKTPY